MDTSTTIAGIVIILAIIAPIFLYNKNSKKKKKQFINDFFALGEANGIKISEYDVWNHYAIGFDSDSKKILYLNNSANTEKALIVNLQLVKASEIQNTSRSVGTNSGSQSVLEQLNLKISLSGKDTALIFLEFFSINNNSILVDELKLIEKWHKLITTTVKEAK